MGLAPYGEPVYEELIREKLIDIKADGSFCLNMEYFDYQYGRTMTNDKFAELFGGPRREPETEAQLPFLPQEVPLSYDKDHLDMYDTDNCFLLNMS